MAQHPQPHHGAGGGTEYSGVLERMNRFQEPEVRQAIGGKPNIPVTRGNKA